MVQDESIQAELGSLAKLLLGFAPYDGFFAMRMPGLSVYRASRPYKDMAHGLQKPSLCLVAQGAKSVFFGPDEVEYDTSRMLVVSVDVPVGARVTQASPEAPFISLKLELDPQKISELALRVFPHGLPQSPSERGIFVSPTEKDIVQAAIRLLGLLARPDDTELLAPLVVDEILIRLLRSPIGVRVAQIGKEESRVQRVSKAISWVRDNFDQPLDVERLALLVNMSSSSFHQHFKSVTSMSPLQYQKVLRLQEARRLILTRMLDAGSASRQVGYLSNSQFSREYRRYFGHAPTRDLVLIREGARAPQVDEN
ncbi:AraC family transcriptional regulator [Holophaga foetida]|uniref:AraC family transcriptional regulator n=1 Tax=Holophaga foetida TaxID=35839 RepID=UPI00024717FE|nr:AraC family transcriptional regulator [Holophaga foetida]